MATLPPLQIGDSGTAVCSTCGASMAPGSRATVCARCALEAVIAGELAEPEPDIEANGLPRPLGNYELLEEIARGGMGVVFKARQRGLDRIVAVKMLLFGPLANQEFARRFRTEAVLAGSLRHPNIVAVHEVGLHEDQHYLVMDYVAGPTLAQLVRHEPMSAWVAAGYVRKIAEAVHYAHERGVLHRDLKPSNILIDETGEPHVTDFGLAKRFETNGEWTQSVHALGSPNYMPPEQAASLHGKVSRRSDVYGLGAILYQLVAGRPPFVGQSVTDTLHAVIHTEPLAPRILNPSVPKEVETICLKCLEKEPIRRYATAADLAEELGRFLEGKPILAQPIGAAGRAMKWARREPRVALSLSLIFLLLTALAVTSWWGRRQAERLELTARQRAYASEMNLAQQALQLNNLGRALDPLERQRPLDGEKDLRGWEWRYLWSQCRSDALETVAERPHSVSQLSLSSDGRYAALAENYKLGVSLLDFRNRDVQVLPSGLEWTDVVFSPQEGLLAFSGVTSGGDPNLHHSVRLWDTALARVTRELPLNALCGGIAFSGDGSRLLTVTSDPTNHFVIWNVQNGEKVAAIPVDPSSIASDPFAAARDLTLATCKLDGRTIGVVDLTTGKLRWSAMAADEYVTALAFSPDGTILASGEGYSASPIRLWDVASGKEIARLEGHLGWVRSLIFWPDGQTLASGSSDRTIRLWNLATRQPTGVLRGHRGEIWALALMRDGQTLLSGSKDGSVCTWSPNAVRRAPERIRLRADAVDWQFGQDSKSVFTVDPQGAVDCWVGPNFEERQRVLDLGTNVTKACFTADCGQLAVRLSTPTVQVWDLLRGRRLDQFRLPGNSADVLNLRDGGKRLILTSWHAQDIHEWDVAAGREAHNWRAPGVAFSPALTADEKFWLYLTDGQGLLRNLQTGSEERFTLDIQRPDAAAFSPDGKLVGANSGSPRSYVRVFETGSWREVATLRGFLHMAHSMGFSPDGQRLVTGSESVKIWDTVSWQEVLTLKAEGSILSRTRFSPDGKLLGIRNARRDILIWRAPSWEEIETAERAEKPGNEETRNL